jgi:hypothetical protein
VDRHVAIPEVLSLGRGEEDPLTKTQRHKDTKKKRCGVDHGKLKRYANRTISNNDPGKATTSSSPAIIP